MTFVECKNLLSKFWWTSRDLLLAMCIVTSDPTICFVQMIKPLLLIGDLHASFPAENSTMEHFTMFQTVLWLPNNSSAALWWLAFCGQVLLFYAIPANQTIFAIPKKLSSSGDRVELFWRCSELTKCCVYKRTYLRQFGDMQSSQNDANIAILSPSQPRGLEWWFG